jgi:diketogulonate reductase-like aldo/keto reductase
VAPVNTRETLDALKDGSDQRQLDPPYSPYGQTNGFPKATSTTGTVLQKIATAYSVTARQVALAFLLRDDAVFAIPKASSIEHLMENSGAGELKLSLSEIAEINAACPAGKPGRSLPMI